MREPLGRSGCVLHNHWRTATIRTDPFRKSPRTQNIALDRKTHRDSKIGNRVGPPNSASIKVGLSMTSERSFALCGDDFPE
jgi:hypothetical protein